MSWPVDVTGGDAHVLCDGVSGAVCEWSAWIVLRLRQEMWIGQEAKMLVELLQPTINTHTPEGAAHIWSLFPHLVA